MPMSTMLTRAGLACGHAGLHKTPYRTLSSRLQTSFNRNHTPLEFPSAACGRNQRSRYVWPRAFSTQLSAQHSVLFCNFSAFRGEVTDKEAILFVGESTYPGRIFKVSFEGKVLG